MKKLIIQKPFKFDKVVDCHNCEGTGQEKCVVNNQKTCGICGGTGRLIDVREGTVSLYRTK